MRCYANVMKWPEKYSIKCHAKIDDLSDSDTFQGILVSTEVYFAYRW